MSQYCESHAIMESKALAVEDNIIVWDCNFPIHCHDGLLVNGHDKKITAHFLAT